MSSIKKTRRERPHIALAPDQPLTAQGKPRTRVYVACVQCRTRKIRCDGAKPSCHNCSRRATEPCAYDRAPKRRGPDKIPGTRQRTAYQDSTWTITRRKRPHTHPQPECCSSVDAVSLYNPQLADIGPSHTTLGLYLPDASSTLPDRLFRHATSKQDLHSGPHRDHETYGSNFSLTSEPSLQLVRQMWWDSLLAVYFSFFPTSPTSLSERQRAANQITNDLRFLFRHSNYWLSFINVPHFFSIYLDHEKRLRMQPSILPAALAVATFFQSSEVGYGNEGRRKAMRLRDVAQGALEASLNACWIDEELAQAAWLLALFEICAHPDHASERCSSGLVILDNIIRALSLTLVDMEDPTSSRFLPRSVPSVTSASRSWAISSLFNARPDNAHSPHAGRGCSCVSRSLAQHSTSALEYTPLWLSSPAWDCSWSESEIRKESCRRLCWSTLLLTAGHTSYVTAASQSSPELFVLEPANIALLFPGEAMRIADNHSGKDTIWSLNYRTILLWNSCLRMQRCPSISETDMTRFAMGAWIEADLLEQALDSHECGLERTFLFQGREYLFNARSILTHEFRRYMPLTALQLFRKKATEWLTHEANVAERVVQSLGAVTGHASHTMIHRPFFAFWFMSQISRALYLWERDNSFTLALDAGVALFKPIDFLSALWPCSEQRRRSQKIRDQLVAACKMADRPLPPEPAGTAL